MKKNKQNEKKMRKNNIMFKNYNKKTKKNEQYSTKIFKFLKIDFFKKNEKIKKF